MGVTFINNEVLVVLKSDNYKADLDRYLANIGGSIVGELSEITEYQVLLENTYSYAEISEIVSELQKLDWVIYASPNYAMEVEPTYTPNDSKWKNKWEDVPDGGQLGDGSY